jgi:ligand-binding sensor domain-containing protein/two-component sensor histidine kinase
MRPRLFLLLLGSTVLCRCEKLPLKIYTAADGLAHNSVNRIVRDSRGYLWFCTSEGLSRFDGYEFRSYGRRDGLPHRAVNDLLETRNGDLWVATAGGLCQYATREQGKRKFQVRLAGNDDAETHVNVLLEDRQGRVWCGTDAGLCRLQHRPGETGPILKDIELGMPRTFWDDRVVSTLLDDSRGDLWVGAGSGLYRLRASGAVEHYTEDDGLPQDFVTALLEDQQHSIWVGTHGGLCKLIAEPAPGRRVVAGVFTERDGLGSDGIAVLHQLGDGTLCVGTKMGLSTSRGGLTSNSAAFSLYTAAHGLPVSGVEALAEDSAGNLWIGTDGSGAAKLAWKTFLTYSADDGLRGTKIETILEDRAGELCVVSRRGSTDLYINEFDGSRFRATRVNLPQGAKLLNWGTCAQSVTQDREGDWWIATTDGLQRYSGVSRISDLARRSPAARYAERDGLSGLALVSVFEDSARNIWLSSTGKRNGLAKLDRRDGTTHFYSDRLPWLPTSGVSLFTEDGSGQLWLGILRFGRGQPELARLRKSSFELVDASIDASSGGIRALHLDRQERLWVGTDQNGLMRFDHPDSDQPAMTRYTSSNGLSSDVVLSLTEDTQGHIYIGNGSGVDRLDVASGRVRRFTSADGLASGEVYASFRDHHGVLWFGTAGGLSRLVSAPAGRPAPPPVVISSLRVGGVPQAVSELGETEISGLRYRPDQNDVEVGFAGVAFASGETLRYQYMLEGADAEWSPPTPQRSVNYANLTPDSYRFLVRAVDSDGVVSSQPASIRFVVLPPLWRRWWFQFLAASILCAIVYWLHRYRVKQLLEVERMRTRIATDLHDDIGSSLSQIAILSEVASRQVDPTHPKLAEPLVDIAGISRELVDSMSDIVWAIDPELDHVDDLVHRMRRFASDVLSPRNIRLVFRAPAGEQDPQMGADLRRQIFLIYKEALHNVLRHSGATEVCVRFSVERGSIEVLVNDNGRGFEPTEDHQGHGLRSMSARARGLGGSLEVQSGPHGTMVALRIPGGRRTVQPMRSPHE